MTRAKTNEQWTMKHFLLWGSVVTHASSSEWDKFLASADPGTFFLVKMRREQGLTGSEADEDPGMTVH